MGAQMMGVNYNHSIVIFSESTIDHFQSDPQFESARLVSVKSKEKQNDLQEIISLIQDQYNNEEIIIYLYINEERKYENLLRVRNFYLPNVLFFPLTLPENLAIQKIKLTALLHHLKTTKNPIFNKVSSQWNENIEELIKISIKIKGFGNPKKRRKTKSTFKLTIENGSRMKKFNRNSFQEILEIVLKQMEGIQMIEAVHEDHTSTFKYVYNISDLARLKDTIRLDVCGVVK